MVFFFQKTHRARALQRQACPALKRAGSMKRKLISFGLGVKRKNFAITLIT
jgi:hypothetical protein